MKNIWTRIVLAVVIFSLILSVIGCQSENDEGQLPPVTEPTSPSTPPTDDATNDDISNDDISNDDISNDDTSNDDAAQDEDEFSPVNQWREDYNFGTCKELSGNVSVVLFYMDDFESEWTDDRIDRFTKNEVEPGLKFLEKEAEKYGIELDLNIKKVYRSLYYDDEVIVSIKETGLATIDVLKQAAHGIGFSSTEKMIKNFRSLYQTEEVVCFTIFNKNGTAYAINPKRDTTLQVDEHCIIFARDLNSSGNDPVGSQSSVVAHEMLHLFGAEDFYASASRKMLAKIYYENDIMLGANYYIHTNNIGKATAFYIGWQDEVPDVLYNEAWN